MIYYTDGGCSPNPGKGGWGFVCILGDQKIFEKSGDSPETTNNRMELTAIIQALKYAKSVGDQDIEIRSDSMFCINTCSKWIFDWKIKNTIGSKKNPSLIYEVLPLLMSMKPVFKWIKAHNGDKWNEYVDNLCSTSIKNSYVLERKSDMEESQAR